MARNGRAGSTTVPTRPCCRPPSGGCATTPRGLIVGIDRLSGQLVCHAPLIAYEDRLVSSPNVAVIGDVGKGKSSLLKPWGTIRQLLLDRRRVVVLDKKLQAGVGEYTAVARAVGAPSIRFTVD